MSNYSVLAHKLNEKDLECSELKEKLRKWERLAISSIRDLMNAGWEETKLRVKNEMLSSNVELVEKDLKDVSNQAEKVEVWAEKLECDKKILQNDVRILMEELAITKWKVEKAEKELKVVKDRADKAESDLSRVLYTDVVYSDVVYSDVIASELEKKDLESARILKELAATIVDLRVRLSNCGHWSTYGVIPNIWDAMALIRKEVNNVPTSTVTISWSQVHKFTS